MEKYQKTSVADQPRVELHDVLGLTGAEVSVNRMPAGASVPFVHSHKQNEEIYGVLSGRGTMTLDGVRRQISAAADSAISYVCIQVKAGSLGQMTAGDAVMG